MHYGITVLRYYGLVTGRGYVLSFETSVNLSNDMLHASRCMYVGSVSRTNNDTWSLWNAGFTDPFGNPKR